MAEIKLIKCPNCGQEIPVIEVEKIIYHPPSVQPLNHGWPPGPTLTCLAGSYVGGQDPCGFGGCITT